jgi:putative Mn2+ efflux pump MntP
VKRSQDPTRRITLLVLSIATSLDALAVGLSYSALHVRILYPSLMIGIVAACLTFIGSQMARPLGKWIGKKAELVGGLILILIGIKILSEHL